MPLLIILTLLVALLAALGAYCVVKSLKTGRVAGNGRVAGTRGGSISRQESPVRYWCGVGIYCFILGWEIWALFMCVAAFFGP